MIEYIEGAKFKYKNKNYKILFDKKNRYYFVAIDSNGKYSYVNIDEYMNFISIFCRKFKGLNIKN